MKYQSAMFAITVVALSACEGERPQNQAVGFDGIANTETVYFSGNEPFWGGEVAGDKLRYSTPENVEGDAITVSRFVGNSGLGFSGNLGGQAFDLTVTSGECSDTMADRTYPFTATLKLGDDVLSGCAWTDAQPLEGDAAS